MLEAGGFAVSLFMANFSYAQSAESGVTTAEATKQPAATSTALNERLQLAIAQLWQDAIIRFERGNKNANAAELHRALDELELAIGLSPKPGLVFAAALVHQKLGNCSDAARMYRQFIRIYPESKRLNRAAEPLAALEACAAREPYQTRWVVPRVGLPLSVTPTPQRQVVAWSELGSDKRPPTLNPPPYAQPVKIAAWSLVGGAALSAIVSCVWTARAWSWHKDLTQARQLRAGAGAEAGVSCTDPQGPYASNMCEFSRRGSEVQSGARWAAVTALGLGLASGIGFWWLSDFRRQGNELPPAEIGVGASTHGITARYRLQF